MNMNEYVIFSLVGHCKANVNKQATTQTNLRNDASNGNVCLLEDTGQEQRKTFYNTTKNLFSPLIVVAVDFGSTFSGYSFVFTKDKSQVRYMRKNKDLESTHKVPTAILLDHNKKLHSFGHEAQNYFYEMESKNSDKWHYFENFKMAIHKNQYLDHAFKLSSSNGKSELNALQVFSSSLKYLCSQAMQEISDQLAFELTKEDISWVITVPAIWNESAKQFMRKAAIETGLVCPELLHIALEPEVASLYCFQSYGDQSDKEKCANGNSWPECRIEQGTNYVIIDAGGGSVDITFHQILSSRCIHEIHKSSGLPSGSFGINEAFEKMLNSLLGSDLWQQFRKHCPSSYLDLMHKFELRKREARLDRKNAYNIALSFGFIQFFTSHNVSVEEKFSQSVCPKGLKYNSKLGIMRVEASLMLKLFDEVIEPMKRHIKGEINRLLEEQNVDYAFLVGGFAQSDVLRDKIKKTLQPETLVVIPPNPHLAVLNGAAIFGLDPTIIRSRRAMKTYGIGVLAKLDLSLQSQAKTIIKNGEQWCCDVFDRFVTINQPIGLFESVTRRYTPVLEDQTFCLLHIYSTESETVRLVTEPCVRKCGTIYLELQSDQLEGKANPAIKQIMKREIEAQMFFGETEIKICVTDLQTGKLVKANVNFLSN